MLAENLKKIRKDKGYTQEILAEKLNVVRQTVSKWEKGLSLPDVDMLSKIANVLETDVNILLDGQITTTDQSEIVKQLAKINEQLTIKNRRYKKNNEDNSYHFINNRYFWYFISHPKYRNFYKYF